MNPVVERLRALRSLMKEAGLAAYMIPTSDFHDTEYVADYFAARKYFSGFTGSAGTLVVLEDKAALWTDGRYFIQAAKQLEGSGIELMKSGIEGTPTMDEYILSNLKENDKAGFDGRTISYADARKYRRLFQAQGVELVWDEDLITPAWSERPALKVTPTFHYDEKYAGKGMDEKLADLRAEMKKHGAKAHIVTKIDEIAWLYNLRANDIPNFPVALAYTIVYDDHADLYIDASRLDETSKKLFEENNVFVKEYNAIYDDVKKLEGNVLLQPSFVNSAIAFALPAENIIEEADPIILAKAKKNEIELENTRNAHIKDGAAVVRFMRWLEQNVPNGNVTEMSAQEKLQEYRKEQPLYLEDSFDTICAYKEHAAMMHYSSKPETNVTLKPEGMLLVDSGGQYLDGTTDITRTFVLGPISEEEKYWFTKALQGHVQLQQAKFLYGCRGLNLDILSRGPLWLQSMDYQCGTGHGVGHLLSVHEPPNGFRWRIVPERSDSCVLEEGMITSNEPGVYEEGKFGIRHENEMVTRQADKNKYGQFMVFENLTFVPFDVKGIDTSLLNASDIAWINDYHAQVYEKVSPLLNEEEAAWLKEVTAPIS
jgi:Xaa-Pro aminopeptidase